MKNIEIMCGKESDSIIEILDVINKNGLGTAFILDSHNKFLGLVTDGDIRRAILKGKSLKDSIKSILNTKPIVAKPNILKKEVLHLMLKKKIIYVIPVLNNQRHLLDFYHLSDFIKDEYKGLINSYSENNGKKEYILITGGAGYIGSFLSRYLLKKNCKIRVLDKLLFGIDPIKDLLNDPNFDFVEGDFTDISIIMKCIENVFAVIHLAAVVGDPAGNVDPDLTREVNQYGVKIFAEICKIKKINRFIFVSTCSVYGHSKDIIDEDSKLNPISLYAETKLKAEQNILNLTDEQFHPTIIRLATIFGLSKRMRFDLVINLLTAKAVKEKKIIIFAGDQWRPFVHIKDVVRAINKILKAPEEKISGQIFNVGFDKLNYKIKDLAPIYKKIFTEIDVIDIENKEDNRSYRVSFKKIKNILNFDTKYEIEDGLIEIQKFFNNNPNINYKDNIFSNVKNFKYGILNALTFED